MLVVYTNKWRLSVDLTAPKDSGRNIKVSHVNRPTLRPWSTAALLSSIEIILNIYRKNNHIKHGHGTHQFLRVRGHPQDYEYHHTAFLSSQTQ